MSCDTPSICWALAASYKHHWLILQLMSGHIHASSQHILCDLIALTVTLLVHSSLSCFLPPPQPPPPPPMLIFSIADLTDIKSSCMHIGRLEISPTFKITWVLYINC